MFRIFFLVAGASCLGACTQGAGTSSWASTGPQAGAFNFDWRLSGDPTVAPMQVFDDGKDVWLQFAPGQAMPAIFGVAPGKGELAVPIVRRDPYVVVAGAWQSLRFRGGRLTARAQRDGSEPVPDPAPSPAPIPAPSPAPSSTLISARPLPPSPAPSAAASPVSASSGSIGALAEGGPLLPPLQQKSGPEGASSMDTSIRASVDLAPPGSGAASDTAVVYRAAPPDTTLRGVLARWAGRSGWTFAPQHWAVDVDIPLSAAADFTGDFKSVVRQLLAATELAEKPLQPCFYGNQVLRVVPLAQSCSRSAPAPGGGV